MPKPDPHTPIPAGHTADPKTVGHSNTRHWTLGIGHWSFAAKPHLLLLTALSLLLVLHLAHFADILNLTQHTPLKSITIVIRANITPFAWCAYLLFLLGLLSCLDRSSWLKRYRNRILVCWLWSVPAWCYFDWLNFYFMRDPTTGLRAWEYVNLPPAFLDRLIGYLLAFGAIAPGMFLTAEVLQRIFFHRMNLPTNRKSKINNRKYFSIAIFLFGLTLAPIPIFIGGPISNLALWVGTWALLDPLNLALNRPSIIADWFDGRFGRTLSLALGGLICGFLWEFWNYWSFTKWLYHLPFLGQYEHYKYFEMPIPGLIGFIAFGLETWTMWQTALLLLSPLVEAEQPQKSPTDLTHHNYSCF